MNLEEIRTAQRNALLRLLDSVLASNPFHQSRLARTSPIDPSRKLEDILGCLPLTTKADIVGDQAAHPPYGTNLTLPLRHYVRCHQTSGTTGHPIRWLDTPQSWDWMLENWRRVLSASGVTAEDVMLFAFSFGPFLGFWTAFESASAKIGALCLSGGGLSSEARAQRILEHQVTALCCTPTYAVHLAEVAAGAGLDLTARNPVRRIIVAGEPGGGVPAIRRRIENLWPGARLYDHHGMTEIGPVSYPCPARPGDLHVLGESFIAEILRPGSAEAVPPGECGELVLTNLGRTHSPLMRYRTGDWVLCPAPEPCACGTLDLLLEGGIRGRTDDMVVVRGVNLYPSAVDAVVRAVPEVAEYEVVVRRESTLTEVVIRVEPQPGAGAAGLVARLEKLLQEAFLLRIPVQVASVGTLPRFEHKARRWRTEGGAP